MKQLEDLLELIKDEKNIKYIKPFKFISQEYDIIDTINSCEENTFRIIDFSFQILLPNGNILNRELNYEKQFFDVSIKKALTFLVIRHSPKWYYLHVDTFPVKVITLKIKKGGAKFRYGEKP